MDERIQKYEEKMKKTLGSLEAELTTIRAGRANPHILDKLTVDYYGSPTPIQQVKDVKKKGEAAKVAVRNIRRDANDAYKKLKKEEDVSEDEIKELEDKVQKLTDKYIKDVDAAVEAKGKEIMTV